MIAKVEELARIEKQPIHNDHPLFEWAPEYEIVEDDHGNGREEDINDVVQNELPMIPDEDVENENIEGEERDAQVYITEEEMSDDENEDNESDNETGYENRIDEKVNEYNE